MKKRVELYLTITLILLSIIIFYTIILLNNSKNSNGENNFLSFGRDKPEETGENQPDTGTEERQNSYNIKNNGADSSSGSGAGSQTTNPKSSGSCYTDQVTYSIGDIKESYICNSKEEDKCVNKIAKCSVKVNNFDDEISGIFEVKFTFFEKENLSNIISTSLISLSIGPKDMGLFNTEELIQGEDADKNLSCHYSTIKVPRKEICI